MKIDPCASRPIKSRLRVISPEPELIPFVNIFFLLIIFFMMGSSFVSISGIKVELPPIAGSETYSVKKYIVTLDDQGRMYFNDTVIDNMEQLRGKLISDVASAGDGAIVIRADMKAQFGPVARIMALADELKINVFILARRAADSAKTVNFTD